MGIEREVECILPDRTGDTAKPNRISGSDILRAILCGSGPSRVTLPFLYICLPIVFASFRENLKQKLSIIELFITHM